MQRLKHKVQRFIWSVSEEKGTTLNIQITQVSSWCPKYPHDCSQQDSPTALELTNCTVDRTVFILEKDDYGIDIVVERKIKIALARCPICKSRYRVLPADILPHKLYSLPVIELTVSLYNRGDLSLRQVAWDQLYGERTPEHTTLHGWTEGLGAYCLGRRIGEVACALPATRILARVGNSFLTNEVIAFNTRLDKPVTLSQPGASGTSAGLQTV